MGRGTRGGGGSDDGSAGAGAGTAGTAAVTIDERRLAGFQGERLYRAAGLLFLFAILYRFFDPLSRMLLIAFVGAILGVAFNAIVVRMPMRRGFAVALLALATLGALVGMAWLGVRMLVGQVRALIEDFPAIVDGAETWIQDSLGLDVELMGPRVRAAVEGLFGGVDGGTLMAGAFGVVELLALMVLILAGAFFIVAKPNHQLLTPLMRAVPRERRPAFRRMFERLGERLAGWLWGSLIAMVAVGAMSIAAYYLIGVPYPLLMGVLMGVLNIIPLVGPWIAGAVVALVTLFQDPGLVLWVALAVLVIQEVESNLIRPYVMSGSAELHPFVTLLALLLFSSMFGILGAILSLPLVLAIGTVVEVLWVEETLHAGDDEIEPVVDA
jgi:predicted PurR-regulated permease PerM